MYKSIILLFIGLCLALTATNTNGYKILMVCPPPAKSHNNLCRAVVEVLADRGHELTFINAYPSSNTKYKEIGLPELVVSKDKNDIGFEIGKMSSIDIIKWLNSWQSEITEMIFNNAEMKTFMDDKTEKFDLVILEYFMNEFLLGYGVKFNCPIMALSPVSLMSWLATLTGNPVNIATIPNLFTTYSQNMNLWERVINTGIAVVQEIARWTLMDPLQEELYKKYFPKESEVVSFKQLQTKIASVLVNSHPSAGISRPLLPNTVEIGGYHIDTPPPLPEDLKTLLDASKDGVIYFAMGSNLKSKDMSNDLKQLLLNAFGNLKETVLWKYEEELRVRPSNVVIKSWLPQTSILAHPNVKLFISHGGLLSMTEATYFGVPLLIIPIFGDQHHNAKTVTERGQGISVSFDTLTQSSFESALTESLNNPEYGKTAKKLQELFHDRPIKPRDLLAYQVEHVIRTNGAPHLSPPILPRYSELLIDVAAVVLIPLLLIDVVICYAIYKCCCGKKITKVNTKSNVDTKSKVDSKSKVNTKSKVDTKSKIKTK